MKYLRILFKKTISQFGALYQPYLSASTCHQSAGNNLWHKICKLSWNFCKTFVKLKCETPINSLSCVNVNKVR